MDNTETLVFLAHPEPVTLFGLSYLINGHLGLRICGMTSSAAMAVELCEKLHPAAIVIDPSLDGGGNSVIKELRRTAPDTRVVVFSGELEVLAVQRAFAAGAHGYVSKYDLTADVMLTLTRALEGVRHASPRIEQYLLDKLAGGSLSMNQCPQSVLSDRELQVYRLMGQGRSRRDLAAELKVSTKTVETHQQRIKAKLSLRSCADLIREAALFCNSGSPGIDVEYGPLQGLAALSPPQILAHAHPRRP